MRPLAQGLLGLGLLLAAQISAADPIPSDQYSLTELTGSWSWGQTDFNAYCGGSGVLDNVADLGTVEALLSDGYTALDDDNCEGPFNGIYPWPDPEEFHAIVFAMAGGANVIINELHFISSRSYSDSTVVTVDYAVDGGPWVPAITTTSGAIGITTGPADTYILNLGGVIADQFRITTAGDQIAFHELMIDGIAAAGTVSVSTNNSLGLIIMVLLLAGMGGLAIRRV